MFDHEGAESCAEIAPTLTEAGWHVLELTHVLKELLPYARQGAQYTGCSDEIISLLNRAEELVK